MDKLDVAIIRELFQGAPTSPTRPEVKLSYRTIGRRLGVSEGTVRNRAGKLVSSGFLRGWAVHPNPGLLGLTMHAVIFHVGRVPKKKAVEELLLVEGTLLVVNWYGASVGVVFIYDSKKALARKVELITRIIEGSVTASSDIPYPPTQARLSLLDWRIIESLQQGIGRPYRVIGKELGVSGRTVRRRVTRMANERALFLLPSGDDAKLEDKVRADLWVKWEDGRPRSESQSQLLRLAEDYDFFTGLWKELTVMNMLVPNVSTGRELADSISALAGVSEVGLELVQERHELYEVFSDMIHEKVEELSLWDGRNG